MPETAKTPKWEKLEGVGGNTASARCRGFRQLPPGRPGGGFASAVNLSPGVEGGGFGRADIQKRQKRHQKWKKLFDG